MNGEFASVLSEILKVDVSLGYFYLWGQLPLRSSTDVTFSSAFRKPTPKSDRCKTKTVCYEHFAVFFSAVLD